MADCDETYNYWEPLHYLLYGYGFQTWEYDPKYALRSFAYLMPYAGLAKILNALLDGDKRLVFFGIRVVQSIISSFSILFLYDSTVWRFGKAPASLFLGFCLGSPGIFRASAEFLPSSWAMISVTLSTAQWLVGQYPAAILGVAVASLLGWPFAAVLGVPLFFHSIHRMGFLPLLRVVALQGIALTAVSLLVDSWYYGKSTIAVLNHFVYNVFPVPGAGPDIFGTEDWTFYAVNLFLNVNVALFGVFLYLLLWPVDAFVVAIWGNEKVVMVERIIYLAPPFLWLFILCNQPHKEERFMAPIYPLLCLVAAVAVADLVKALCVRPNSGKISRFVGQMIVLGVVCVSLCLGTSRTYGQIMHFSAPFEVYAHLTKTEIDRNSDHDVTFCVGKEWYRFPSHFFLPNDPRYRVAFVDSGFDGLLPQYFSESHGLGTRDATYGFNPFNRANPNQFLRNASAQCHFFIDWIPHDATAADPTNPIPPQYRSIAVQKPFLDAAKTPQLSRAFWIPHDTFLSQQRHGQYTVYRNAHLISLAPRNPKPSRANHEDEL